MLARNPPDRRCPRVAVHGGAFTQLQAGARAQHPNGLHSNGGGFLVIALCARLRCCHCGGGAARSRAPRARPTAGSLKSSHVNMRMPFICTTFTRCNSPPGLQRGRHATSPRERWSSTSHPALRLGRRPASSSSQSISKRAARTCALAAYHPPGCLLPASLPGVSRCFFHTSHGTHLLHTTPRDTPRHPAGMVRTGAHTATARRLPLERRRPA